MSVHIKNSSFYGSPIVEGDGNIIKNKLCDAENTIDWDVLQDQLIETSAKLPKSSREYIISKEALNYAMAEYKRGLVKIIKNNLLCFTSDLFKGIASSVLIEFINSLI